MMAAADTLEGLSGAAALVPVWRATYKGWRDGMAAAGTGACQ